MVGYIPRQFTCPRAVTDPNSIGGPLSINYVHRSQHANHYTIRRHPNMVAAMQRHISARCLPRVSTQLYYDRPCESKYRRWNDDGRQQGRQHLTCLLMVVGVATTPYVRSVEKKATSRGVFDDNDHEQATGINYSLTLICLCICSADYAISVTDWSWTSSI